MSSKLPLYAVDKCPVRLWLPAETFIKLEKRSEESGLPVATIVTAMVIEAVKDDPFVAEDLVRLNEIINENIRKRDQRKARKGVL